MKEIKKQARDPDHQLKTQSQNGTRPLVGYLVLFVLAVYAVCLSLLALYKLEWISLDPLGWFS